MNINKSLVAGLAAMFVFAGSVSLPAQTSVQPATNSAPQAPPSGEEVVTMSQFEVTTTQGHGYLANESAMAFKTNEALINIPQGDILVTTDLINDLGYEDTTDILQYFGNEAEAQGEFINFRGSSTSSLPYLDELPEVAFFEDSAIVDSIEVVKGPAQTLYLNAAASGTVLKATKKPLPFTQDEVKASIDDNGLYRLVGDFTGPIGRYGDFDLSYRFVGVFQHGPTYFLNNVDDRYVLFPELGVKYHNTTLRVYYDLQKIHGVEFGNAILTPSGSLYTGAGRKDDNMPPGSIPNWEEQVVYLEILSKISDHWENRLSAGYWNYTNSGVSAYPISVNYTTPSTGTEEILARSDVGYQTNYTVLDDWQGHYSIANITNSDIAGFGFSSQTAKQAYWVTANFPGTNSYITTIPINSVAALNAIVLPSSADYSFPSVASGGPGSLVEEELAAIYLQHTIDIIPKWVTFVLGFTFDSVREDSVSDWAILPFQSNLTTTSQYLHRVGLVVHLTEGVSLYALNTTNFIPPSTGSLLESGLLPPNQLSTNNELGLKWNLLGGRLSGEAAWFKLVTTNGLNEDAGSFPNGLTYTAVIGSLTLEGVDGDATFSPLPGWQIIGSWYAGHQVDPFNHPVPFSFDNSWGAFTRYEFEKTGLFKGLSIGGGVARVGGRWMPTGGITLAGVNLPTNYVLQTGTSVNAFAAYQLDRHWLFRVTCDNILNQAYPLGAQASFLADPSPPTTFILQAVYRY